MTDEENENVELADFDKVRSLLEACKIEEKVINKFYTEEVDWDT